MDTPVRLAQQGAPTFEIRLTGQASAPEEFAGEELRRHLLEIMGARPTARSRVDGWGGEAASLIFINDRQAAEAAGIDASGLVLGPEAYHIETRGGNLYFLGGGPRGVLYAVYDLLDELGCRWFTPEISHIPRRRNLALAPRRKTFTPVFESRDTFNWECRDPLWWVRNRMNGWYTPVPEYMGGQVSYCGFVHTFYSLLPPDQYFADHPEYYSLAAGARRRDHAQLCLTNPEVLRIVTRRVLELMRENPRAAIFSVSQNDCYGYCECEACRAVAEAEGSQSGPVLRFVNAVAEETAKVYPEKLIDTLAYQYTLDAPRRAIPHPNVRVRLCSINCCQGHAYGTCSHPESARFLRALDEWGRRTSQMYIWHYATNFAHYPLPMPDFDELQANLDLYRSYGVHGLFIQGMGEEGGGAEAMALRGWVVSRLLWNPQQPVWPLVDEFLGAYYGKAAPLVRRYLDVFHARVREDRELHPSLYDPPSSRLLDDDLRLPADAALAEAEKLVVGSQLRRVKLLRGGLRYARLWRACGIFKRIGDVYQGEAKPEDRREFEALVGLWRRAGIQRVREAEPFDVTVQALRSRLAPHRVEWLREGDQAIAVVPDLGGRLLEWHAHGHQWLVQPEPDLPWTFYPLAEGYAEFAALAMYRYRGWSEPYRAWRGAAWLSLAATIDGRLQLHRRLALRNGKLHIESRLVNRSGSPTPCAWGVWLRLALPAGASLSFDSQGGEKVYAWEDLLEGQGAALTLTGAQLPLGEWRVRGPGFLIRHTLRGGPVDHFGLGKREAKCALAVDIRSQAVHLEPGAQIAAGQVIEIEAIP